MSKIASDVIVGTKPLLYRQITASSPVGTKASYALLRTANETYRNYLDEGNTDTEARKQVALDSSVTDSIKSTITLHSQQ